MNDLPEIPENLSEQAEMLKNILIDCATGGSGDANIYKHLRKKFMGNKITKPLLPSFVQNYLKLSDLEDFIEDKFKHKLSADNDYKRGFVRDKFIPLIRYLEDLNTTPGDNVITDTLKAFDIDSINAKWAKALERRTSDPDGALTLAKSLLEDIIKHILDKSGQRYSDRDDLPKLYHTVAEQLNLAPSQESEIPIRAMLGSITNLVNGIGTLRNRLSDAHGSGEKIEGSQQAARPSIAHAYLAVNTAGAMAMFLIQTYEEHQDRQTHE